MKYFRFLEKQAAKGYAAALASREYVDKLIGVGTAERIHRKLELAVEFPCITCVELFLNLCLPVHQFVHISVGIAERFVDSVELGQEVHRFLNAL